VRTFDEVCRVVGLGVLLTVTALALYVLVSLLVYGAAPVVW
jgi:hypothetical protein